MKLYIVKKNFSYLEINVTLFFQFPELRHHRFRFFLVAVEHKFVYGCKNKIGDRSIIKRDGGRSFLSELVFPAFLAVRYEAFESCEYDQRKFSMTGSIMNHDVDLRRNSSENYL